MMLELKLDTWEKKTSWKSHFSWKQRDVKSVGTSKMEVSEGFQVYCREGATHWREFKKLIDRREN